MSAGESKDYKFGTKNNWRRRVWNELRDRIFGDRRDSLVLYLSGEQDLDRPVALSKGFPENGMIAVDRSQMVVDRLRGQGKLAICGDLLSVLESWPPHRPVDAVIGDFCSGLEKQTWKRLRVLWQNPAFTKAVCVLNFQRGREHSGNEWREGSTFIPIDGVHPGHRGALFLMLVIGGFAVRASPALADLGRKPVESWTVRDIEVAETTHAVVSNAFCKKTHPLFLSYRSGRALHFDSVIFSGYLKDFTPRPEHIAQFKQHGDVDLRRQIAAVLAHRTRRLNALSPRIKNRARHASTFASS